MQTLKFHKTLYSDAAIQEAMDTYRAFGQVVLTEQEPYALVEVKATADDLDEAQLAGELANFALARSIEQRRSQ